MMDNDQSAIFNAIKILLASVCKTPKNFAIIIFDNNKSEIITDAGLDMAGLQMRFMANKIEDHNFPETIGTA